MAVRYNAPIYTTEQVLNEAGIILELNDEDLSNDLDEDEGNIEIDPNADYNNLSKISTEDLYHILEDSVKDEDFDTALKLQEEIKKRNKKID